MQAGDPTYYNKAQHDERLNLVKGARSAFLQEMSNLAELAKAVGDRASKEEITDRLARFHSSGAYNLYQSDIELVNAKDIMAKLGATERATGIFQRSMDEMSRKAKEGMKALWEKAATYFGAIASVATGGAAAGAIGIGGGAGFFGAAKKAYDDAKGIIDKNEAGNREAEARRAMQAVEDRVNAREQKAEWERDFMGEAQQAKQNAVRAGQSGRMVIPAMAKIESLAQASGEGRI